MDWYQNDFYNEPSEFDIQVDEFKQSLMKSVKKEFVSEMERLSTENKELQDIKANFEAVKRDFENKKRQLESEYQILKSNVRRERLVDILRDHKIILYKAYSKREYPPKCEKCDKHRKVNYISPLGRMTSEDCSCKEGKTVYYPEEYIRYEFRLNRDKNGVTAWYRQYNDDEDGFTSDSSIHADYIYSPDMNFEDLKRYSTFFKTKEECQAYCDYLNSKEE
jgi:HD superfamily phosphohydrolase